MLKFAYAPYLLFLWVPLNAQQLVYVVYWSDYFSENGELVREDSTHLYYSEGGSIFPDSLRSFRYNQREYILDSRFAVHYDSLGRIILQLGNIDDRLYFDTFYYESYHIDSVKTWVHNSKDEFKVNIFKDVYVYRDVFISSMFTVVDLWYEDILDTVEYVTFEYERNGKIKHLVEIHNILNGENTQVFYYNSEGLLDSCIDGNDVLKPVEYDFYDNVLSNDILANVQMMGFLPPEEIVSYLLPFFGFKRVVGRLYDDEYGEGRYEMTVNVKYVSETERIEEVVMTEEYANKTFQEKYVFYFRGDSSRLFMKQVQEPLIWDVELVGGIFLESSLPIDRVELISAGGNIIFIKKIYRKTNFVYDASQLPAGKYFLAVYSIYGQVNLLPVTIK